MSKISKVRIRYLATQVLHKRALEKHNTPVFDQIQQKGGLGLYLIIGRYQKYKDGLTYKEKSNPNIKANMLDSLIYQSEILTKLQGLNRQNPNRTINDHQTLEIIAKALKTNGMFGFSEALTLAAEKLRNLEKVNTIIKSKDKMEAAKSRYTEELSKYKKQLTNWAANQYKLDADERFDKGMITRPKKGDVDKWLLDMYLEDIEFRANPNIKDNFIESENIKNEGCPNASPESPIDIVFNPSKNFFYQAIKTKT
ncbi:hypothetical protein CJF42_23990 [Pseudoalteromonas sp. NBT06-2]|nr:hypothetical protein CJF42_23990 [Pseudoalteromonas sp. NBT06-2]